MSERELFEAWAKDRYWTCARNPYDRDLYQTDSTQMAWWAWKARAELQQSDVLRTALERIANADHAEDGGPTCDHAQIAEDAL